MSDKTPSLGACCACLGFEGVRNIISLPKKAPVAGRGWGCFVCGLLADGAIAVVCDSCLEAKAEIKFACVGYPGESKRIPVEELQGDHAHDMSKHSEERA